MPGGAFLFPRSRGGGMRPLVLMSGLAPGGAERVTVSFLRHLMRLGETVPLCTVTAAHDDPGLAGELDAAGVERIDLRARRLADPGAACRLAALLGQRRFDLVHAHGQDAAILAWWVRRVRPFRLVATRHVVEEPTRTWKERARARAAFAALARADAVVAVSRSVAERLVAHGISRGRIHIIPNGIDLSRYDSATSSAAGRAIREGTLAAASRSTESTVGTAGNGPPGPPLVLVPAVLRAGKGHDVLLDAVPTVLDRLPGTVFLLAGDGPLRDELAQRARELGASVRLLGHRDDMPALMAAADLVCLPSLSEALPTVLLEAAAAGRPAVATRVGGVPEVVEDGRTGVLVPAGDPLALGRAIWQLLENERARKTLSEAALAKARAGFGLETQVQRTLELWRKVNGESMP